MHVWDFIALPLLGYLSVPLVSLATRKHWPDQLKWAVAIVFSLGFAVGQVWLHHEMLTQKTIEAAFGLAFVAQQATWHLSLPGAGSPSVNEALLHALDPAQPEGANPEQPLEDAPAAGA